MNALAIHTNSSASSTSPTAPSLGQTLARACGLFAAMTLVTGVAYPLIVTGISQAAFSRQANGSMIVENGQLRGSALIGQSFSEPKYFWGRLSATTPGPYNAAASGGSNLGPTNEALASAAKARIDALREADPGNLDPVPVDLVTASGSGLDPHVSVAAAEFQVVRVAKARGLDVHRVRALVEEHTKGREFGFFGEPVVNVLLLNLALDR